jgi:hypothetical protein
VQTFLSLKWRGGVQFRLGGIKDTIVFGLYQNFSLYPDFMFEIIAQIAAKVPVNLLLNRETAFIEPLLIADHEILHFFSLPFAQIFLQTV